MDAPRVAGRAPRRRRDPRNLETGAAHGSDRCLGTSFASGARRGRGRGNRAAASSPRPAHRGRLERMNPRRRGWMPNAAIMLEDMERLVPIGTYATRTEAEVVEGLLASAGIAASIRADDAGGAYPFVLSGGAQVLVEEGDAEAASQLLAEQTDKA